LKIIVCCIGKTKSNHLKSVIADYLKRLSHYTEIELAELSDAPAGRDVRSVLLAEEQIFAKKIQGAQYFILDEKGQNYDSRSFAAFIQKQRNSGKKNLVLVIGGAHGFSEDFKANATGSIALSALTFPHDLVRLIMMEQLYRAHTILAGEKYHHD
jgi:23S rRNA (pseudouridine1915-N3)-methyltransferase